MTTFKLECMADEFAAAIAVASQASGKAKQLPLLKAVRIAVAQGKATVAATNLDHAVTMSFAAKGGSEVYIEIDLLLAKANALRKGEPVTIEGDPDAPVVIIKQGRTRWKVPTLDGSGWPTSMFEPVKETAVACKSDGLFATMNMAMVGVDTADTIRVVGQGIFIDPPFIVATDGKKFIATEQGVPALGASIVLPFGAIGAIANIFRDEGNIRITADKNALMIATDEGDIIYKTKLIESPYPDWRWVRDKNGGSLDKIVTVDREQFLSALTRATSIGEDRMKIGSAIGVRIAIAADECIITARNRVGEEGVDVFDGVTDDAGEFAVNSLSLVALVNTFDCDRLVIRFSDIENCITIWPDHPEGEKDYRLLMPYRV